MIHQYRGQVCFPTFCISLITRHHPLGSEPSTIGSLDASEEEGIEGCHDMDPITGEKEKWFSACSDSEKEKMLPTSVVATQIFFYFHPDPWRNHPI